MNLSKDVSPPTVCFPSHGDGDDGGQGPDAAGVHGQDRGDEQCADGCVEQRGEGEESQDRDPVHQTALGHLRHRVLPQQVRARHRHRRHLRKTHSLPDYEVGVTVTFILLHARFFQVCGEN